MIKKEQKEDCGCCNGCACGCKGSSMKWIKPAVTIVSALTISWAILQAGVGCPCKMGKDGMPPRGPKGGDAAIAEFIAQNPKAIIDSVDAFYRAQQGAQGAGEGGGCGVADDSAPAAPAGAKPAPQVAPADLVAAVVADKTNHVLGNKNGKFVIIEFFDYQCGWCKKTNTAMAEAVKKAPNIRWILIDSPIFGPDSERVAAYAFAAGKQGKYKEMHEAIAGATGKLDEAALTKLAEGLKLNMKKLKADAEGQEFKDKLVKNREMATKLKIGGVPMLIVNGKINPGALFGPALDEVVAESNKK